MGADAPKQAGVGLRVQKLGAMPPQSQKYFNAQRDVLLKQGTFKNGHDGAGAPDEKVRGTTDLPHQLGRRKAVDKSGLLAFVVNESEKRHMCDPDHQQLFTAKRRVDEPGAQSHKDGLKETLAEVIQQDPTPSRYTQVKKTKKQKYKDFVDSSQGGTLERSYLDNYKRLRDNQEKETTK